MIEIYTDGSYSRKLNKGAYAVACFRGSDSTPVLSRTGVERFSSSNKCEMLGLICALDICLKARFEKEFKIWCDSQYCVKMYNSWMDLWRNRGWKKSKGRSVKNIDLVKKIYELRKSIREKELSVKVKWVKGHNGDERNEYVDNLASEVTYGVARLSRKS